MWPFKPAPRSSLTGVYQNGFVRPHHSLEYDVPVPPRLIRRHNLNTGDRVAFDVSPHTGRASRILVYRRHEH
jgi:transcription termination factor Rho